MKPTSTPHDPLDELLAAAVHGELTAAQRAELDALLQNDPAARAACQEIQAMHDLLERNHQDAKPDPAFEDRMISGVRRKARAEAAHKETPWESVLVLWRAVKYPFVVRQRRVLVYALAVLAVAAVFAGVELGPITNGIKKRGFLGLRLGNTEARYSGGGFGPADKDAAKEDFALIYRTQKALESKTAAAQPLINSQAGDMINMPQSESGRRLQSQLRLGKARLLAQQGRTEEAMKEFQESAQAWPGNPDLQDASTSFFSTGDKQKESTADQPTATTRSGEQSSVEAVRVFPTPQNAASAWNPNWVPKRSVPSPGMFGSLPTGELPLIGRLFSPATTTPPPASPADSEIAAYQAQQQKSIDPDSIHATIKGWNPVPTKEPATAVTDDFKRDGASSAVAATASDSNPFDVNGVKVAQPLAEKWQKTAPAISTAAATSSTEPSRKLIRDAQLDLEVKSYQNAVDAITSLAGAGGGYVDSSSSQRGGNGKLQGTVVVKVLPENLDAFLLKLRALGEIKNQSVSTQDVTKDYYDTQARLDNSHRMEAQLQLLLQHTNGKVSDLLQVERELGRVRGDIETMQGQLKLYDFQVQYATITITVAEKDLNKAAAYLLQEHDQFSLFVHNVEDAFAQAKTAADTFKAQILSANLQHDSGNNIGATMAFSVPPDQIDGFLDRVKSLGRVDNFTRTTQRVANDGGDPDQPADQTRTEKDPVQVQLSIRADDESPRQQTQLSVASTGDIDAQAQQIKDDAVKNGAAVITSNFERAPDGTETATIALRLALSKVADEMATLEKLGRVESLTVQRNDRPGQAAADPSAPAEIDLKLHNMPAIRFEDEQPRQATELAIASSGDVDAQALQMKSDALKLGMAVTASTFERQPDGTEQAAMTFRLPMTQAANFTATLEKLGKVESLAVQRNDVTGPNSTDPNAPAEISLTLHNEPAVVAENRGFWTTLRHTFGGGIEAFFTSVQTIGVLVAFIAPWVVALGIVAWIGRRIYVAYRARIKTV